MDMSSRKGNDQQDALSLVVYPFKNWGGVDSRPLFKKFR